MEKYGVSPMVDQNVMDEPHDGRPTVKGGRFTLAEQMLNKKKSGQNSKRHCQDQRYHL